MELSCHLTKKCLQQTVNATRDKPLYSCPPTGSIRNTISKDELKTSNRESERKEEFEKDPSSGHRKQRVQKMA